MWMGSVSDTTITRRFIAIIVGYLVGLYIGIFFVPTFLESQFYSNQVVAIIGAIVILLFVLWIEDKFVMNH